jgi:hypothetical protein
MSAPGNCSANVFHGQYWATILLFPARTEPADVQHHNSCQRAADRIMAAPDGGDVGAATERLALALFIVGKLKP